MVKSTSRHLFYYRELIQAKAKTASLEAKAASLKESQAIKMAAEELELKRMVAQAKAEQYNNY